jgi:hypothetical protein
MLPYGRGQRRAWLAAFRGGVAIARQHALAAAW